MKKILYLALIFAVITICIFALSMTSSAATTKEGILPFEDVKESYWYAEAAEFCYVNGVINGVDDAKWDTFVDGLDDYGYYKWIEWWQKSYNGEI